MMEPVHPGEVLAEDFLGPMGLSQYRLAKEIKVPLRRVLEEDQGNGSAIRESRPALTR